MEKPEMWEHRSLWIVSPPPLERKRIENGCLYTWIDQNLIREPLETSTLMEGTVVVVGE
jgi:hypothetical protein